VIFRIFLMMTVFLVSADPSMAQTIKPLHASIRESAMSGGCGFGMSDTFGGTLSNGESDNTSVNQQQATYMAYIQKEGDRRPEHIAINFSCQKGGDFLQICREMAGVEFKDGKWEPTPRSDSNDNGKRDVLNPVLSSLDRGRIHGALYIKSDATGPIQFRLRTLGFCMSNGGGATLWGDAVVENAPYSAKKSTESEAIRLIKSIEFQDISK
jgi:hypothetical protein